MRYIRQLLAAMLLMILMMACTLPASASDPVNTASIETAEVKCNPTDDTLFKAGEVSVDLFAQGALDLRGGEDWGAGLGLNYFPTVNFGVGVEASSLNLTGSFVDQTSVNLYARLPFQEHGFAPYAFGGGGYEWETSRDFTWHGGVGVEFRTRAGWGVFIDARQVFRDGHNSPSARAGVRVPF